MPAGLITPLQQSRATVIVTDGTPRRRTATALILAIVITLGLGLRTYYAVWKAPVIGVEGAEYVRMAQNLRLGNGLVGLIEGPQTMYAPFYPVLIAATATVVDFGGPDRAAPGLASPASNARAEFAAHALSLAFGVLLIFAVFKLASLIYSESIGLCAAALISLHPVLIKLSASVYTEAIYLTLWISGIYFALSSLQLKSIRRPLVAGILFGFAYLTRPEAFAYPVGFAIVLIIMAAIKRKSIRTGAIHSAVLLITASIIASPYVLFLHRHTGEFRLEGKWDINYTIGNRMNQGLDYFQAAFGTNYRLEDMGPLLVPSKYAAYTPYRHTKADVLRYMWGQAKHNRADVYAVFTEQAFGSPMMIFLVVIGLFSSAWSRERFYLEFLLGMMALSILILLFSAHMVLFRYTLPLLPIFLIWSASGLFALRNWTRNTWSEVFSERWNTASANVCAAGFFALLLLISVNGSQGISEFNQEKPSQAIIRTTARWIDAYAPGPKTVSSIDTVTPYYANANLVQFPCAGSELSLQYLESRHPDFVVLSSKYAGYVPTVAEWLEKGIPARYAHIVYDTGKSSGYRMVVYQWHK